MALRPTTSSSTVALAVDSDSSLSYSFVREATELLAPTIEVDAPGLRLSGRMIDDALIPTFQQADLVIALWSTADPIWTAFQVGLANGLGRRVINVSLQDDLSVRFDAPVAVEPWIEVSQTLYERVRSEVAKTDPRAPSFSANDVKFVCPSRTKEDEDLRFRLSGALQGRSYQKLRKGRRVGPVAGDLLWVITPHELQTRIGRWRNIGANLVCALEAGRHYGLATRLGFEPALTIARWEPARPIAALEHLVVAQARTPIDLVAALGDVGLSERLMVKEVALTNVKSFEHIRVPLSTGSPLGGAWTCIAGVNGAGKTTLLQSIAIALLGRRRAVELGLGRIGRMVRRTADPQDLIRAEVRLQVTTGAIDQELALQLSHEGIEHVGQSTVAEVSRADLQWDRMTGLLVVSYGATRSISDGPLQQFSISPLAQRQLTLFDPVAQIAGSEALTAGGERYFAPLMTLAAMLTAVLDSPDRPFRCTATRSGILYERHGAMLTSLDLPDGYRSIVAILADIALGWHDLHPQDRAANLREIEGIVLVDELDLHLHASLQREIVPRLREALPGLQWIVTTHSPLVAASFDRSELVLLDDREPTGLRELDRDVLTFTSDELYEFLLDTIPTSAAGMEQLAADSSNALLYQSPNRNAQEAAALAARQEQLLKALAQQGRKT